MNAPRDLPNTVGFRFTGIFRDGSKRECVVAVNEAGMCTVDGYSELVGWIHLPKETKKCN